MVDHMRYSISRYDSCENVKYRIESHDNSITASGHFYGWIIVPPSFGSPFLKITMRDGQVNTDVLLESRKDVRDYFSNTPILKDWKAYGFNLSIEEPIEEIALVTQDKLVFSLERLREFDNHVTIINAWSHAITEKESDLKKLANNITCINEPYVSLGPNAVQNSIFLDHNQKKSLAGLIKYLESERYLLDFTYNNGKNSLIRCDNVFETATCINSFYIKNINVLSYINNNNEIFYILQHFSSFDGLYYPKYNLFYAQDCINPQKNILKGLVDYISTHNHILAKEHHKTIYLCGHSRPYHFLYDNVLGLGILNQSDDENHLNVISNGNSTFLPLSSVKKLNINERIVDNEQFTEIANGTNICFLIGMKYSYSDKIKTASILKEIDSSIVKDIKLTSRHNTPPILKEKKPLIWFGITSQKRQWLNQVDGITSIINSILNDYPNAAFVIDGWTSPINKTASDYKQIESDMSVYSKIKSNCKNANIFTTIGLNSLEKISIGSIVDFFMANSSTGAVHIDRICRVPGISHGPNVWNNTDSIHISSAVKINNALIKDVNPDKYQDSVDYLIDIKDLVTFFKREFNKAFKENLSHNPN